jgi:hypothetical protein
MGTSKSNSSPQSQHRAMERRARVMDLRKQGASYPQILDVLREEMPTYITEAYGLSSIGMDITRALSEMRVINRETAREVRDFEVQRLDEMFARLYPKALGNELVPGDEASVRTILKIMERRSKLLGLDAPALSEVILKNGEITDEERADRTLEILERARTRRAGSVNEIE